jgi:hypothetical protein
MGNAQLTAALTEQLSRQAASDPVMAMLLEQMTSVSQQEPDEPDRKATELRSQLTQANRKIERLRAELAAANAMAAYVARVLGACERCWGLNQFCRACLGRGRPGSADPDTDALTNWIAPALRRAGLVTTAGAPGDQRRHPSNE